MRVFITSTGTATGKSFVTCSLVGAEGRAKRTTLAYKPIISGFDPEKIADSDTGLLLSAAGIALTPENIERISPWRFSAPLAPSMAAKLERRPINFDALIGHGRAAMQGPEDNVLIEGVGGIMAPITDRHTVIDWIAALDIQALLVTGSYLGALSHTLTALEVLKQRHISVHSVIVNQSENSTVSLNATVEELSRWTKLPLTAVARRTDGDWHDVKELRGFLA